MNRRSTGLVIAGLITVAASGCDVTGPGLLGRTADESTVQGEPVEQARVCRTPVDGPQVSEQLIRLINSERFERGPVEMDAELTRIAGDYACRMIGEDFFAHEDRGTGADVSARLSDAGYVYTVAGENLAAGYWSPSEITEGWMSSPSHRQVLLDTDFSRAGVAVRYGGSYGVYCVLILADEPK